MNFNLSQKVAVQIGDSTREAVIDSMDGFSASVKFEDGTVMRGVDLGDLHHPDMPLDNGIIDPIRGNPTDQNLAVEDRMRFIWEQRRNGSFQTIEKSLRVHYRINAVITSTMRVKSRLLKTVTIFTDDFGGTLDDWRYVTGSTDFSIASGQLVATAGTALLVPPYAAYRWISHGVAFTLKTVPDDAITLGAAIEGGWLEVEITSGVNAIMRYRTEGGQNTTLETVAFATTFAADDEITLFDNDEHTTLAKNGVVFATFTNPTPGRVKSAWGFHSQHAFHIDDFTLIGTAREVRSWPLALTFNLRTPASLPPDTDEASRVRVRQFDSNLSS